MRTLLPTILVVLCCHSSVLANPERLAADVTIYRDTYGVPHVFGRADASTVFGFAYAQAEDSFWRIEENFIHAVGRASEVYGEKTLDEDRLNHALEIPRLARDEYRRLDPHMRLLCDAFAAGLNYYLAQHPSVRPRLLTTIEPWYTLAFIRYNYFQNGFAQDRSLRGIGLQTARFESDLRDHTGSNGWVLVHRKAPPATRCCSLIRTCHSLAQGRFTKVRFIVMRVGISPVTRGSDFRCRTSDITKTAAG